jgi:hypothetical protein
MDEHPQTTPVADPPEDDLRSLLEAGPKAGRSKSTVILAAVVLAAVGFIGGLFVGKNAGDDQQQLSLPGGGQNRPGFVSGAGPGAGFALGTIKSIDGDTITLETANGDTVTVHVGSDTKVQVTTDGSVSDLGTGDTVAVSGAQNGGSIDADSITEGGAVLPAGNQRSSV